MHIDGDTGILKCARQDPSPNHDDRPDHCDIDLIVIHNISLPPGEFGGPWIDALFCNRLRAEDCPGFNDLYKLRVSAHVLIRRNGELVQYVPFCKRAWHAGQSAFKGRTKCNDFSIGIEMEGSDFVAFTAIQYAKLVQLTKALMICYPRIELGRITGHNIIAPSRKTDPGPCFDWEFYLRQVVV